MDQLHKNYYQDNKFGYYQVGNNIITHKVQAVLYATDTKQPISWNYHNEIWSGLNWQDKFFTPLEEIYKQRAQQLRDKYDYLVLSFSGGSDSYTVLSSFLKNNIHLDEIFIRWPWEASSGKFSVTSVDKHPSNILSEWELTILPTIKEIEKNYPKTKISLVDWSDTILKMQYRDHFWTETIPADYFNISSISKWVAMSNLESGAIEKGKSCALITGIDKPQLWADNGKIYVYFLDKLVNMHSPEVNGRTVEHFYWTPDLPEIVVRQASHLFLGLQLSPQIADLIDKSKPYNPNKKTIWNNWARQILYKDYSKLNLFQANKSYTNVLDEVDNWMSIFKDYTYYKSWQFGLKNLFTSVDPKYVEWKENEVIGLVGFVTPLYFLGDLNKKF